MTCLNGPNRLLIRGARLASAAWRISYRQIGVYFRNFSICTAPSIGA
jgi:hypothetical protein